MRAGVEAQAVELRAYLVSKGISEDIAHDVAIHLLQSPVPIRHPKAWGWRKAMWLKIDQARAPGRDPLPINMPSASPDPSRVAASREQLDRYFAERLKGPSPRGAAWVARWRGGKKWRKGYLEDYRQLQRDR